MRNPDRIPEVLLAIEEAWTKNPQLRLGQLIAVACQRVNQTPFDIDDDDLMRELGGNCAG